MPEPRRKVRPQVANRGAQAKSGADQNLKPTLAITDARNADTALHVAWLRVHADLCYAVDPSGRLSAQLWDHARCIEAMAEGRR
jgi:hypothetical protein